MLKIILFLLTLTSAVCFTKEYEASFHLFEIDNFDSRIDRSASEHIQWYKDAFPSMLEVAGKKENFSMYYLDGSAPQIFPELIGTNLIQFPINNPHPTEKVVAKHKNNQSLVGDKKSKQKFIFIVSGHGDRPGLQVHRNEDKSLDIIKQLTEDEQNIGYNGVSAAIDDKGGEVAISAIQLSEIMFGVPYPKHLLPQKKPPSEDFLRGVEPFVNWSLEKQQIAFAKIKSDYEKLKKEYEESITRDKSDKTILKKKKNYYSKVCSKLEKRREPIFVAQSSCFGGGIHFFTDLIERCDEISKNVIGKLCVFTETNPFFFSMGDPNQIGTHGPLGTFKKIIDKKGDNQNINDVFDSVNDSILRATHKDILASTDWHIHRWSQTKNAQKRIKEYIDIQEDAKLKNIYLDEDPKFGLNTVEVNKKRLDNLIHQNKKKIGNNPDLDRILNRYTLASKIYNQEKRRINQPLLEIKHIEEKISKQERLNKNDKQLLWNMANMIMPTDPRTSMMFDKNGRINIEGVKAFLKSPIMKDFQKGPYSSDELKGRELSRIVNSILSYVNNSLSERTDKEYCYFKNLIMITPDIDLIQSMLIKPYANIITNIQKIKYSNNQNEKYFRRMMRRTLIELLFFSEETQTTAEGKKYLSFYSGAKKCLKSFP